MGHQELDLSPYPIVRDTDHGEQFHRYPLVIPIVHTADEAGVWHHHTEVAFVILLGIGHLDYVLLRQVFQK